MRHLPGWWQQHHGDTPLLAETFVDPPRFESTAYEAAVWNEAGTGLKTLWLKPRGPVPPRSCAAPVI